MKKVETVKSHKYTCVSTIRDLCDLWIHPANQVKTECKQ